MHETDLPVDDPSTAHVVVHPSDGSGVAELTRHRRGMLTSLSVLVTSAGPDASALVHAVTDWAPPQYRIDFVLVADGPEPDVGDRAGISRHLDRLAWAWESVERPAGGRASAIDRASAVSTGEFVVVATAGVTSVEPLTGALGHLWVNGADALIVGGTAPDPGIADDSGDTRADRLGAALGLRRGAPGSSPGIVVLRRWVARFLFDDIGRALDPIEEFAERVQLLELRLVEVVGAGRLNRPDGTR